MVHTPPGFRGTYRTDAPARAVYSEAAGIAQILPLAVAVPVDAEDVMTLVRWAASERIALIPRGSGSSMAGGAIGEGVIVDVSRLDQIEELNVDTLTLRCGPGVLRDDIDARARAASLAFPVDPSSGAFCTIGGMASTNASGAHTLRYGSTRGWIHALDCVFSDGTRGTLERGVAVPDLPLLQQVLAAVSALSADERQLASVHRGVRKESSGYGLAAFFQSRDLIDLVIGSEGTLAIIVGVVLILAPRRHFTASLLGAFASLDDAVRGAAVAREAGASACELIDRTFLDVARQGGIAVPGPRDAESVLLVELEGDAAGECEALATRLRESFLASRATDVSLALDSETEHAMWELRHAASPVLSRLDPALKSMQFIEDGCVPPDRLAEYVMGVRAALKTREIRGVIFGHAGDAHVHVNPLIDVRLPDWRARLDALLDDVVALTERLGGTLTGEHGDGRLRAPLLDRVWPAAVLERFGVIKSAFDPQAILNPGAKISLPGQAAVSHVKYDPDLSPLPASARAVLARVESERCYANSRLAMLDDVKEG